MTTDLPLDVAEVERLLRQPIALARPLQPTFPPRAAPHWSINGTGLKARAVLPYAEMLERFGNPRSRPTDKSENEWFVHTPHGPVAVYDYCFSVSPRSVPLEPARWHIGAHNDLAAQWIARYIVDGCRHLTYPGQSGCGVCEDEAGVPNCCLCADCWTPTAPRDEAGESTGPWEWFIVHEELWTEAVDDEYVPYLCVGCLEVRLGRRLTSADFADLPVNELDTPGYAHLAWDERTARLRDRLTPRPDAAAVPVPRWPVQTEADPFELPVNGETR